MYKLKHKLLLTWIEISSIFRREYISTVCSHWTQSAGVYYLNQKTYVMRQVLDKNGKSEYCIECLGKMTIRCAWCGNTIHIGDPVTLYAPIKKHRIQNYAVKYQGDTSRLVGCMSQKCCDGGMDRAGFWVPPGKVERVPSPMEMLLQAHADSVFAGKPPPEAIIIQDMSNPNDHGKIV